MKTLIAFKIAYLSSLKTSTNVSAPLITYFISGIVKDVSNELKDEHLKREVHALAHEIAEIGSSGLKNGWEDGDICPPYFPVPPFPWPEEFMEEMDTTYPPSAKNILNGFSFRAMADLMDDVHLKEKVVALGEIIIQSEEKNLLESYRTQTSKRSIIDQETVSFFLNVQRSGKVENLLNNPSEFAKKNNLDISRNIENRIEQLKDYASQNQLEVTEEIGEEIMEFYNKAVVNGKYVKELLTNPRRVAKKLDIKISDEALAQIEKMGINKILDRGTFTGGNASIDPLMIVFVVCMVAMGIWKKPVIIDRSGIVKF